MWAFVSGYGLIILGVGVLIGYGLARLADEAIEP